MALFKKILGAISPAYGAATGEGAMGKLLNPNKAARNAEEERARNAAEAQKAEADRQAQMAQAAQMNAPQEGGMKKGGRVKASSASSRADGIAQRGKTRGKIV
jgi:hypothetical protein